MSYRIITDNCCDFPADMYGDLDVAVVPLVVRFQDGAVQTVQSGEVSIRGMYGYI